MAYGFYHGQNQNQNSNNAPQRISDSEKTRRELSAQKQLGRFDAHFNDPDTVVNLDKVTSSKDGNTRTRYIVSRNGREKYVAKFVSKNNRQQLEEIVSLKRTKDKRAKKPTKGGDKG